MTDSKLLDSSLWVAFAIENNEFNIINSEEKIFTSCLSIFEIKKKLLRDKIETNKINKILDFIKKRSIVLQIDEKTAEKASEISLEKALPAIDSLIYSSALLNNLTLITLDNDFRNLKNVQVLEI